jgi:hypothetical protein
MLADNNEDEFKRILADPSHLIYEDMVEKQTRSVHMRSDEDQEEQAYYRGEHGATEAWNSIPTDLD